MGDRDGEPSANPNEGGGAAVGGKMKGKTFDEISGGVAAKEKAGGAADGTASARAAAVGAMKVNCGDVAGGAKVGGKGESAPGASNRGAVAATDDGDRVNANISGAASGAGD